MLSCAAMADFAPLIDVTLLSTMTNTNGAELKDCMEGPLVPEPMASTVSLPPAQR